MPFLEGIFRIERPMACHRPTLLPNNIVYINGISITSEKIRYEILWIKIKVPKMPFLEDIFESKGRWHAIGQHYYQIILSICLFAQEEEGGYLIIPHGKR